MGPTILIVVVRWLCVGLGRGFWVGMKSWLGGFVLGLSLVKWLYVGLGLGQVVVVNSLSFPNFQVLAETMVSLHESTKCAHIVKVFEDAYKSLLSIIVLDDIERLLEYVAIGPSFSNIISQTLLVLLKRQPPKGKKLLVIGTTSEVSFLDSIAICNAFSVTYHVPTLKATDAKKGTSLTDNYDASMASIVTKTNVLVVEGYLFEFPDTIKTITKACNEARNSGALVVVTTSDVTCIERHYDDFW